MSTHNNLVTAGRTARSHQCVGPVHVPARPCEALAWALALFGHRLWSVNHAHDGSATEHDVKNTERHVGAAGERRWHRQHSGVITSRCLFICVCTGSLVLFHARRGRREPCQSPSPLCKMAAPVPRSRIKLSSAQATVREQICGGLLLHIGCGQRVAATGTCRAAETAENGRHGLGRSILIGQVHVAHWSHRGTAFILLVQHDVAVNHHCTAIARLHDDVRVC